MLNGERISLLKYSLHLSRGTDGTDNVS